MSSDRSSQSKQIQSIDDEAARWFARSQRGLKPSEQDQFLEWLADDPRHAERFQLHRHNWRRLDRLAEWKPEFAETPNPDLLARRLPANRMAWLTAPLALAAVFLIALTVFRFYPSTAETQRIELPGSLTAAEVSRTRMPDGSIIKVRDTSTAIALFTAQNRIVELGSGEAFFDIVRDTSRPFVVSTRNLRVVAVGTAFNVRITGNAVEVAVSEGSVRIEDGEGNPYVLHRHDQQPSQVLVAVQQIARVPVEGNRREGTVTPLSEMQLRQQMSWQHGLLKLDGEPLSKIVDEFNRLNETQMVVTDQRIEMLEIGGTFRSDNVKGFVALLEMAFGVSAEHSEQRKEYYLRMK